MMGYAAIKCIPQRTAFQISFSVLLARLLSTFALLLHRCQNLRVFQSTRVADHSHNVVIPEQWHGLTHTRRQQRSNTRRLEASAGRTGNRR